MINQTLNRSSSEKPVAPKKKKRHTHLYKSSLYKYENWIYKWAETEFDVPKYVTSVDLLPAYSAFDDIHAYAHFLLTHKINVNLQ